MAAAAAAMEQVAAASKLEPSSQLHQLQSQQTEEESLGSPSPPVDHRNLNSTSTDLILPIKSNRSAAITTSSKTPFLKFSVSAILSKAKEEIHEDEAVKSSEGEITEARRAEGTK